MSSAGALQLHAQGINDARARDSARDSGDDAAWLNDKLGVWVFDGANQP